MVNKSECLLLGSIGKPHGTKGAFTLLLRNIKAEEIKKRESVFVEIDGLLVPFFIDHFQIKSSESVILKFEGICSESKAKIFAGNDVFVRPDQVVKKGNNLKEAPEIFGYNVQDVRLGFVGIATAITGMANNPLLMVSFDDKEYLIPVHKDIIQEINDLEKKITIDAPEGLFDL
jgi:16S rRNA processing protein RimM